VVVVRHRDIDDSQHHEYVGLQQHDQYMEDRPPQAEQETEEGADYVGRRLQP